MDLFSMSHLKLDGKAERFAGVQGGNEFEEVGLLLIVCFIIFFW